MCKEVMQCMKRYLPVFDQMLCVCHLCFTSHICTAVRACSWRFNHGFNPDRLLTIWTYINPFFYHSCVSSCPYSNFCITVIYPLAHSITSFLLPHILQNLSLGRIITYDAQGSMHLLQQYAPLLSRIQCPVLRSGCMDGKSNATFLAL